MVATAYIDAQNEGDVDAAAALIAPGAKARTSSGSPYEVLANAAAIRAFINASPPCVINIESVRQTGSTVVVAAVIDGASSPSCPVPVGTGVEIPLTIVNGLITVLG